jgi:hypothetical protein
MNRLYMTLAIRTPAQEEYRIRQYRPTLEQFEEIMTAIHRVIYGDARKCEISSPLGDLPND